MQKRPKIWWNQKQKDRFVLSKPKLNDYISRHVFERDPDSKNSPKGPKMAQKSAKEAQNFAKLKTKNMDVLQKPKIVYIGKSQKDF